MFWFKSCPRCDGDLYGNSDIFGSYVACFQCGYYLNEPEVVVLRYSAGKEAPSKRAAKTAGVGPAMILSPTRALEARQATDRAGLVDPVSPLC